MRHNRAPAFAILLIVNDTQAIPRIRHWLRAFLPQPLRINQAERWRSIVGALIGIAFTAFVSQAFAASHLSWPWLVAPLGASAVLVFAVPASPLAQPWAVIGGNTVSALVGVICALLIADPAWAGAVAVGGAIGCMFFTRSLHPPGGAMALLAVLTHATQWQFVLFPALTNSVLLVLAGVIYNSALKRRYPHRQVSDAAPSPATRFAAADLDAVLARYNQVLDVSRDDLENILQATEMQAMRRQLGELRCVDIMTADVIAAQYAMTLQEAWALMRRHRIKALPVIDRSRRILGIVTLADFMRHADIDAAHGIGERLRTLIKETTALHTDKPEVVGQIMTSQVRVASAERPMVDLVPLFSEGGHHHIPIIDLEKRLVGIITESDFVRALYRSVVPPMS